MANSEFPSVDLSKDEALPTDRSIPVTKVKPRVAHSRGKSASPAVIEVGQLAAKEDAAPRFAPSELSSRVTDPLPSHTGRSSVFLRRTDGSFVPRSTIEHLRSKIEKNLNINQGAADCRRPPKSGQQLQKSKSHGLLQAPIQVDTWFDETGTYAENLIKQNSQIRKMLTREIKSRYIKGMFKD